MKNRMIHYHLQQPFSQKPNRKQKEETLKGIPLYNRIKKHNIRMKQTFMNSELTTIESLLVRSTTAGSDPSHVKSTTSSPYRKDDGV